MEGVDLLGVRALLGLVVVFLFSDLFADQRRDDLPAILFELARRDVRLQDVILGSPVVARHLRGAICARSEGVGHEFGPLAPILRELRELHSAEAGCSADADWRRVSIELRNEREEWSGDVEAGC